MPAGTITLTNNSTAVTGSGTAFATELKANDFLVAVVGGTTYTLGVKSVESATALTLTTAYGGPTTGGLAWTPIPNGTLVGITAQIAADTARAIRGLNYDKQNWQQVYSASGNITVTLPDGSAFTGPSWNGVATALTGKADKASLGTAATLDSGAGLNQALTATNNGSKSFGLGAIYPPISNNGQVANDATGFYRQSNTAGSNFFGHWGVGIGVMYSSPTKFNIYIRQDGEIYFNKVSSGVEDWRAVAKTSRNTTVDSNGFLKTASPVVKLFGSGECETNLESEGCKVTRLSVGEYLIEGCHGLNADASWGGIDGGFDIPTDRNKQPLIWLDYEVNADGAVLVKTSHRTHPDAPTFAQNRIGYKNDDGSFTETVMNGDPVDIPADQFVSVRVEMPQGSIFNQKQAAAQKAMEEADSNPENLHNA